MNDELDRLRDERDTTQAAFYTAEEALAAYYETHRDDFDQWAELVESPQEAIGTFVMLRFLPEDAALLRRLCREHQQSFGDLIRAAVGRMATTSQTITVVLDGATVGTVTSDLVSEMRCRVGARGQA